MNIPINTVSALEQFLAELQQGVSDARVRLAVATADRDANVRTAVSVGMSKYRIAQVLGVSPHAVTKIIERGGG